MEKIDLTKNFTQIIKTLEEKGLHRTNISKKIGFTTTAQLNNVIHGKSLLSTKAILKLLENFSINPTFLFFGKGEIFNSDLSKYDKQREENEELTQWKTDAIKDIMISTEQIKRLEKRISDLIDITTAALKYHKNIRLNQDNDSEFFEEK